MTIALGTLVVVSSMWVLLEVMSEKTWKYKAMSLGGFVFAVLLAAFVNSLIFPV